VFSADTLLSRKGGEVSCKTRSGDAAGNPANVRIRLWRRRVSSRASGQDRERGFTLLELMLAVGILAVVTTVTYMAFAAVVTAWKRGTALTDALHHGDFVVEQLVMGMRSAYYPDARGGSAVYGFQTEDRGGGLYGADSMSWVKLGYALVGKECPFAGGPHRVKVSLEADDEGREAVAVRAWRVHGQPEDFDPDEIEPVFLSARVRGLNCRSAYREVDGEIEWLDEWDDTNRLPTVVEITLYLDPLEEGGEPVEIKRVIGIPVAELSWQ